VSRGSKCLLFLHLGIRLVLLVFCFCLSFGSLMFCLLLLISFVEVFLSLGLRDIFKLTFLFGLRKIFFIHLKLIF